MSMTDIHRIDDEMTEDTMIAETGCGEWSDGTPAEDFTPSRDAQCFTGFPYYLVIEDGDLSWCQNREELIARLDEENQ